MNSRRERLRELILYAQNQQRRRYDDELKREICAYAEEQKALGDTIRDVARDLNLSYRGLCAWLRHARRRRASGLEPFGQAAPYDSTIIDLWATETSDDDAAAMQPMPPNDPASGLRHLSPVTQQLWLVVRAEYVYVTEERPEGLTALLDAMKFLA